VGIPDENFRVDHASFDDLQYEDDSFDLIFSNEAFLHSADKTKLMQSIARLLRKDGVTVFSDILEAPNVDQAKLQDVYSRLDLTSMGNHELYDRALTEAGLQRVMKEVDSTPIIKHYGMILYSATALKRDELLGPGGVSEAFLEK